MMFLIKKSSICLALLLLPCLLYAKTFRGKAVKISDGDTFVLLMDDKSTVRIRLYGIDCPERGQDFGKVATSYTQAFLKNKTITAVQRDKDRYGRIVALVYVNNQCLNEKMLENGLAWHYTQHDTTKSWSIKEQQARAKKVGLWKSNKPMAPWLWRKQKRKGV
jgi:micrococcal nuclease